MRPLVIIPTYNEIETLEKIVAAVQAAVPEIVILVVDDNSPDGTGQLAHRLKAADRRIQVLARAKKEGLGRAYQAGFHWSLAHQFEPICTMDADFSHDPAELPTLIKLVDQDLADIAVGSRYVKGGQIVGWTWERRLLSSLANRFARLLLSLKPVDVTAGYKCYRRAFLKSLNLSSLISPGYAFQVEMMVRAEHGQWRIREVPITFRDRTVGRSKVSRHELISSAKSLVALVMQRRGIREMGKFSLVGALNFSIDIGVTNLGILVFDLAKTWAGYLGVVLALANSFYFNRQWTFRIRHGKIVAQALRFFLINGLGATINAGLYTFFLVHLGLHYNLAKLLAIGGSVSWNFLGTKFWVFAERRGPVAKTSDRSQR